MSPRTGFTASAQLAQERTAAYDDARSLALELGRGSPSHAFDDVTAGVVLAPREAVYRSTEAWVRIQSSGRWGSARLVQVVVSNQRLLCRLPDGGWTSLWWNGVLGLEVDLVSEHVILDYGDGQPVAMSGVHTAALGVAAVALVHGLGALLQHPALASLRTVPMPRA